MPSPRRFPPLPDASGVAFCRRRRRRLRVYWGGDGRGGGSSVWYCRARPPATQGKFCRVPGTRPPWPESLRSSFPAPLRLPRSRRGGRELRGGRGVPGRDRPYGRAAGRPGRPVIRLGPADARDGCRAPPGGRLYIVRSFRRHEGRDLVTSHALDFQQAGGACGIVRVAPACRCPASGPEVAPAGLVGSYGRLHGSTSTRGRSR